LKRVFAAYFSREEDISNDEVLACICFTGGIDAASCLPLPWPCCTSREQPGPPTSLLEPSVHPLLVGDDMYFGNDRLPLVEASPLLLSARFARDGSR
jgi:2-hydroxychromene-2-carboxylate isomerase